VSGPGHRGPSRCCTWAPASPSAASRGGGSRSPSASGPATPSPRSPSASIAVGTVVGTLVIAPLILIGTNTATNNATSSGAFFGLRGRLLGSGLGLALMLFSAALAIWIAGGILVAVAGRLFATPTGDGALAAAYVVLTALSIAVAVRGYHLLRRVTALLTAGGVVFALLMRVAFSGDIGWGYAGGQYALGSRWQTWLLPALALGVGGVMQLATVLGDWSRYVPAGRYPPRRMLRVALPAIALGFIVPPAVGALVTSAFADPFAPWPQGVVDGAPGWFAIVLLVMAPIGGLGFSARDLLGRAGPRHHRRSTQPRWRHPGHGGRLHRPGAARLAGLGRR
jgi:purine-cytosine permease-like protein